MNPKWLDWSQRLAAQAQNGLTFTQSPFERERYEEIARIAAEMKAAAMTPASDIEAIFELQKEERGYATPKLDVRGVVFDKAGRLLLVRELRDGGFTLPGGWVDVGDLPSEAAEREVREESGYLTRATKVLAVWDRRLHGHPPEARFHIYKLFIRCELIGGAPQDSIETSDARFFEESEIPSLTLSLPRTTPSQLQRLFEHYRNPDFPADFD
ncbi:MAG: NUDIX hydrolase N-terminal domain-containing protein [Myxococcales bacterium]|jgi:ADP-ribose pyrophosphatase YjhB (NUDIX family)|nr:NUDIX hydrolase N-terminal domain-containing protein [Myxococcales bacterium]